MLKLNAVFALATCYILGITAAGSPPTLKETPSTYYLVKAHAPLTLECIIEGDNEGKPVEYKWSKDGITFNPNENSQIKYEDGEGTLELMDPSRKDAGLYQCTAKTIYGTAFRDFKVDIAAFDKPKVTLKKHKPVKGKPYKLECPDTTDVFDVNPKPEIDWILQGIENPKNTFTLLNKRITKSPDGNLWFTNVTDNDVKKDLKYVCRGKNMAVEDYVVLAEHVIEDLEDDKETNNGELIPQYLSGNMMAYVDDVTMIYCIYGGTPLAHPDWFKDGTNVNGEPKDRVTRHNRTAGKRLLIKTTILEDQGNYTCVVNNEVGKPQQHTMHLTVLDKPAFTKKPERVINVKEGDTVIIPCQMVGIASPSASWLYNAQPLTEGGKFKIAHGLTASTYKADLKIENVEKQDVGYYACQQDNLFVETLLIVN